jgi:hypothetical protein
MSSIHFSVDDTIWLVHNLVWARGIESVTLELDVDSFNMGTTRKKCGEVDKICERLCFGMRHT